MYTIYRNKTYLRDLVYSLETKLDFVLVRLCDMGITESPTYAKPTDLSYYLVDELKRHQFYNYFSSLTGIPHGLNSTYLKWVSLQVKDEEFLQALNLICDYLDLKEHLNTIYSYDVDVLTRKLSRVDTPYTVKPLKSKDLLGRTLYNVKDFKSKLNTVSYEIKEHIYLTDLYYKYFVRITSSFLPSDWTFFQGMTREQEAPFIKMCLEGSLQPTNTDLIDAWKIYFQHIKTNGVTLYKDLGIFIEEEQDALIKSRPSMFVAYMNEFEIGFANLEKPSRPIYLTPLLYSKEVKFEKTLQLRGFGGEFTLKPKDYSDPAFPLKLEDGKEIKIYKKRDSYSLTYNNYYLDDFYMRLRSSGAKGISDGQLIDINASNFTMLYNALTILERGGYEVGSDKNII